MPVDIHSTNTTMTDATTSPQTSPIASATSEVALVVPPKTKTCYVIGETQALEYRKIAGGATGGKAPIPSATWFEIPCLAGQTIYLGRASATAVSFVFELYT